MVSYRSFRSFLSFQWFRFGGFVSLFRVLVHASGKLYVSVLFVKVVVEYITFVFVYGSNCIVNVA